MKPTTLFTLAAVVASATAVVVSAPATAQVGEAELLAYLNDPSLTEAQLARALDGDPARAAALLTARPLGSLNDVAAVPGVGAPTIAKLQAWLSAPLPPDAREDLEADADLQRRLAMDYLRFAIENRVWSGWSEYPGIPNRLQVDPPIQSGISSARPLGGKEAREETWGWLDPANDGQKYRSAGTSLFNASATAYIGSHLFPLETFKEQIVARGREIEFPFDSAIVKILYIQIPPGLEQDQGRLAGLEATPALGPNGELRRPIRTIEHPDFGTMGLVQVDISTKQYDTWTWMTFKYDPQDGDPAAWSLSPQLRDATWLQTSFDQRYMGPVDNKRSSCIACHQMAQFPRVQNFNQGVAQPDHHQRRAEPYGTKLTKRDIPSMFVDYVWEVTQALDHEEQLKGQLTIGDYPLPISIELPKAPVDATWTSNAPAPSAQPLADDPAGAGAASVLANLGH